MLIQLKPEFNVTYKSGMIFFTHDEGAFISEGIQFFLYPDVKDISKIWTHCGIITGENEGWCSQWNGFRKCDLRQYFNSNTQRICTREPIKLDELGIEPLMKVIAGLPAYAMPYNYIQILRFILADNPASRILLPNELRGWLTTFGHSQKSYVCSEATVHVENLGGYTEMQPDGVDPRKLFEAGWLKPMKTELPDKYKDLVIRKTIIS
jgi:hypothetical protein